MTDDPFTLLGLPARTGLTDDDVRAAWRRIAAATHPDREDGGDPGLFGAAAAAYVLLRTSFGRGEALADLAAGGRPHGGMRQAGLLPGDGRHGERRQARRGAHRMSTDGAGARRISTDGAGAHRMSTEAAGAHRMTTDGAGAGLMSRYRAGAARLAGQAGSPATVRGLGLRVASAAVLAAATVAAVGVTPATIGLLAGALTVTGWALWRRGGQDR